MIEAKTWRGKCIAGFAASPETKKQADEIQILAGYGSREAMITKK
jgi:hypothetical protein